MSGFTEKDLIFVVKYKVKHLIRYFHMVNTLLLKFYFVSTNMKLTVSSSQDSFDG